MCEKYKREMLRFRLSCGKIVLHRGIVLMWNSKYFQLAYDSMN